MDFRRGGQQGQRRGLIKGRVKIRKGSGRWDRVFFTDRERKKGERFPEGRQKRQILSEIGTIPSCHHTERRAAGSCQELENAKTKKNLEEGCSLRKEIESPR